MKKDETTAVMADPNEKRRSGSLLPWFLAVVVGGAGGFLYWTVHRPLVEEAQKKDATIGDLTDQAKKASAALRESETVKDALQAEMVRVNEELARARSDLARSAAQKADDEKLLERLRKEVATGGEVEGTGGAITMTMVDKILFQSGEAELSPQGEQLLRALGGVFGSTDKLIEVCGHADNQRVESVLRDLYPTNWELSVARATNVVRFLQEQVGIKARRLKAAGFGASRPIASNATATGRAKNRRIEILLLPDRVKVVKGEFADEVKAAKPTPAPAHPRDRERAKAVAEQRAKQQAATTKKPAKR